MGLDFVNIMTKTTRSVTTIYPEFDVHKSKDLMVKGGEFYAVWDEENRIWSTDKFRCYELIDKEVYAYADKLKKEKPYLEISVLDCRVYGTGIVEKFIKYAKAIGNSYKSLDPKVSFSNTELTRSSYASFKLDYPLEECPIDGYEELMSTLYSPEERQKLEWAIGSIVAGDSSKIQKFFILFGDSGTGKSTFLNILQWLFDGYCSAFEAKSLGLGDQFAMESFKDNPLVAIDNEADLSRIFDNTRLNSIVAHEKLVVNEKHKNKYEMKFRAMLFMGSNKPVQMTDSKTGLKRRLIDISPTGNLVPVKRYEEIMDKIQKFERPGIAWHCLQVYNSLGMSYYNKYEPVLMFYRTNAMFNFVEDSYPVFKNQDYTTLKQAYDMYKEYMRDNMPNSTLMTKMNFRDELDAYFQEHKDEGCINNVHVRHLYTGFRKELFDKNRNKKPVVSNNKEVIDNWLKLKKWNAGEPNILNEFLKDCKAQYSTKTGTPNVSWTTCRTKMSQIDASKEHYVSGPDNLIVIDFDIKNADGEKDFDLNLKAASKWPKTYMETSRSDAGIHLHYIYSGDVKELAHKYDNDIEVKVYTGGSALRRKLIRCNNIDIATISSGLPLKERMDKVVGEKVIKNATGIRRMIVRNLNKEFGSTTISMHFIQKILDDAYESGVSYDMTDLRPAIMAFAANSTHQAKHCLQLIDKLKFRSADLENLDYSTDMPDSKEAYELYLTRPIVFYDVEVFPNLLLINWKFEGKDKPVNRMINPTPEQVEELTRFRLVGFNCRRYDNHIIWARMMGYTNEQLFHLSQRIIATDKKSKDKNCFFGEAWNLSYTDIYDYAKTKQSLKKWEIQLHIHHQELGLPWDKPVPKDKWELVAEYCDNDVIATEAVWNETQGDFKARLMLVKLVSAMQHMEATPNDTTNSLSTKLIFGKNKNPQSEFIYTDLSEEFPGYEFDKGVSTYKGFETGEGGMVWSDPDIYGYSKTFDVTSMHPSTIIALNLFGDRYTKVFADLVEVRKSIKHEEFEKAAELFDGVLAEFLTNNDDAAVVADALKIVINSIYGLTSASFDNAFRDPRNIDNIVAKRGALFMINLKEEVEKAGYKVFHIKTDSIKVENPDEKVEQLIMDYGKKYGYGFEVEHEWEKICLINDAVYVGKVTETDKDWLKACKKAKEKGKPEPTRWTATGTQFQVPYVFKTLFSHEELEFEDLCETKSVTSSLYLDFNEDLPDTTVWEALKAARATKEDDRSRKMKTLMAEYDNLTDEDVENKIAEGHNYVFVGKVGLFCPVKSGCGGGILLRDQNGKMYSATGADGFRWKEAETIKLLGQEDYIDIVYYETLVSKAISAIEKFGDFESFVDSPLDKVA